MDSVHKYIAEELTGNEESMPLRNDVDAHPTAPIFVDRLPGDLISGNKMKFAVRRNLLTTPFSEAVRRIFSLDNFDLQQGYIYTTSKVAAQVSEDDFLQLKTLAKKGYIDFYENPVIDGSISENKEDILNELSALLGASFNKNTFLDTGVLHLTLNEWENCRQLSDLSFQPNIGAIYSILPSIGYFLLKYYKNIDFQIDGFQVTVAGELHQEVVDFYHKQFNFMKRRHCLFFEFQDALQLQMEIQRLMEIGVELPVPEGNKLIFYYDDYFLNHLQSSLAAECLRIKQSLKKYFPNNDFFYYSGAQYSYDIDLFNSYKTKVSLAEDGFWGKMYETFQGRGYRVMRSKQFITFDFETEDELKENVRYIKSFSFLELHDFGRDNRFKFYVKLNSRLSAIQEILKSEIPNIKIESSTSGQELIFKKFHKSGEKKLYLSQLLQTLRKLIPDKSLHYVVNDAFVEKYVCTQNTELERTYESRKLVQFFNRNFFMEDNGFMYYIGRLYRVHYPKLYFRVEEERLEEVRAQIKKYETIEQIFPDLERNAL